MGYVTKTSQMDKLNMSTTRYVRMQQLVMVDESLVINVTWCDLGDSSSTTSIAIQDS